MDTLREVQRVVALVMGTDEARITPQTSLTDDLGADSLAQNEITLGLEDTFALEFDEDAWNLTTVQEIVAYIDQSRASGTTAQPISRRGVGLTSGP